MEKLWTTTEAAKCLGVQDEDVEELVRQGRLVGYRLGGQFLRFRPDQVEALKGALAFRPTRQRDMLKADAWPQRVRDFWYFYDFYLISATCLAGLIIYLIAAG